MTPSSDRPAPAWLLPLSIIAIALALIAMVLIQVVAPSGSTTPAGSSGGDIDLTEVERRDADDLLAVGPTDAPVALVVFSDYQCPFCSAWTKETLPTMMTYVESGDLRIEWRDVNVYGEASERATHAAYAAALQDRFWEYHHALFPDGEHLSGNELSAESLVAMADELGLDPVRFASDMNSEQTRNETDRNEQDGVDIGVNGTPTFIVGGELFVGPQPTDAFVDSVESALDTASS